jgi:hypothetical protein
MSPCQLLSLLFITKRGENTGLFIHTRHDDAEYLRVQSGLCGDMQKVS